MRGANLNGVDTSTHANASLDAMQKGVELISLPLQVATPIGAGLGFLYEVNQGNYVSAGAYRRNIRSIEFSSRSSRCSLKRSRPYSRRVSVNDD